MMNDNGATFICLISLITIFRVKAEEGCMNGERMCISRARKWVCYDESRSICCGGQVFEMKPHLECCVNVRNMSVTMYDQSKSVCCDGIVHSDASSDCCAKKHFNRSAEVCCQGKLHKKAKGATCCGTELQMKGQVCCSQNNKAHQNTRVHMQKENFTCCGSQYIDRQAFYCDDKDQPVKRCSRNGVHRCCGAEVYDPRKSICCNNTIFENQPEFWKNGDEYVQHRCCGGIPQSVNEEICCEGTVHSRTASSRCCGSASIDTDEMICCGAKPFKKHIKYKTKCCSDRGYYEDDTHLCCDGQGDQEDVLYRIDAYNHTQTKCCNTGLYNSTDSLCCDGEIKRKENKDHDSCCQQGKSYQTFDSKTYMCGINGLVKMDSNLKTCGSPFIIINTIHQLCCRGKIYDKQSNSSRCCGSQMYDSSDLTLQCAHGMKVIKRPHRDRKTDPLLCGSLKMDVKTHLCCRGVIYDKIIHTLTCCGTKVYDSADLNLECKYGIRLQQRSKKPTTTPAVHTTTVTTKMIPQNYSCPYLTGVCFDSLHDKQVIKGNMHCDQNDLCFGEGHKLQFTYRQRRWRRAKRKSKRRCAGSRTKKHRFSLSDACTDTLPKTKRLIFLFKDGSLNKPYLILDWSEFKRCLKNVHI